VTVLLVDTDRVSTPIDARIYGQFLEHINHSVEDGLFAEQIRGTGFEGTDFETYWTSFSEHGAVELADLEFSNGKKSVRLRAEGGRAGIRQSRICFGRNRRLRQWNRAARFRFDDAGGRSAGRDAPSRPVAGAARPRAIVHPVAGRVFCLHI
jgi:hypothetical protein